MKISPFGFSLLAAGAAYCVPVTTGQTANDLASTMVGTGITISNAVFSGAAAQNGIYTGSTVEAQGNANLTNGIILSSGNAGYLNNATNTSDAITLNTGGPGDADLQALIPDPNSTVSDVAALEFDFVAAGVGATTVSFWYTFGSDEYNEFVGTRFNDVFGFFLNGINVALIPGTATPVSINNINNASNQGFYVDNDPTTIPSTQATEMDGFSIPLFVEFSVEAGTSNHLKLAIGDAGDRILDSWVLIGGGSFNNTPRQTPPNGTPAPIPEPGTMAMMGMGIAALAFGARCRRRAIR